MLKGGHIPCDNKASSSNEGQNLLSFSYMSVLTDAREERVQQGLQGVRSADEWEHFACCGRVLLRIGYSEVPVNQLSIKKWGRYLLRIYMRSRLLWVPIGFFEYFGIYLSPLFTISRITAQEYGAERWGAFPSLPCIMLVGNSGRFPEYVVHCRNHHPRWTIFQKFILMKNES